MGKAIQKIELMYRLFGRCNGQICGTCFHLKEKKRDRIYRKCLVYGVSNSEATDWAKSWGACGMYCREYHGREIVFSVKKGNHEYVPLEGQIELEEIL